MDSRATRPVPRKCDECSAPPLFLVQHVEYADHLPPKYVCGRHLSRIVLESEYSEGDEMFVRRIRLDA